jgi:predicted ATP-grasp superfamily ATP-dependent carboligase
MRSKNLNKSLPWAIVLHIAYTGYGVVRSLYSYGIPIIAFQKDLSSPESKSRLCEQIITFNDNDELMKRLISFAKEKPEKPVLFITSDIYVELFLKFRRIFEDNIRIHYPDSDVVQLLLSKDKFIDYAKCNNLAIPKSFKIRTIDDLEKNIDEIIFPAIVKPFVKSPRWLSAKLDKAYLVHSQDELNKLYKRIMEIEPNLLVQEWVPGPDSNVEYCLTYFDKNTECLASFTGAKIRQWPVGTGSTASTKPTKNEWIKNQTIQIFKELHYRGFGSIEYKKHAINGMYYIMEPTVGRPNQQSYVATVNGINMPLIAYESLTGLSFTSYVNKYPPITYIDEWADLASSLVHMKKGEIRISDYLNSIKGKKSFRFFNMRDFDVFLFSFISAIKYCLKSFFRALEKVILSN